MRPDLTDPLDGAHAEFQRLRDWIAFRFEHAKHLAAKWEPRRMPDNWGKN